MPTTSDRLRDVDWLSLTLSERRKVPVAHALAFFLEPTEIPDEFLDVPIHSFLSDAFPKFSGAELFAAFMCLAALHLPNFVLAILLSHASVENEINLRNVRKEFAESLSRVQGPPTLRTEKVVKEFVRQYGGALEVTVDEEAIHSAVRALVNDPAYREITISLRQLRQAPRSPVDRYFSATREAKKAEEHREASYGRLSFTDVLKTDKKKDFYWGLTGIAVLLLLIIDTAIGDHLLIPKAYAQTYGRSDSVPAYKPPFGLPLNIWVWDLEIAFLFLLTVLGVCLWKGFIGTPKNEKAAMLVKHITMLVLGAAVGKGIGSL